MVIPMSSISKAAFTHGLKRICQVFQRNESSAKNVCVVKPRPSFGHDENADKSIWRIEPTNWNVIIELVQKILKQELATKMPGYIL